MAFYSFHNACLVCSTLVCIFFALAQAITVNGDEGEKQASYAPGDAIPVSCLNRTV